MKTKTDKLAVVTSLFMYNHNQYVLDAYDKFKENIYRQGLDLFTIEGKLSNQPWRLKKSSCEKKMLRVGLQQPLWYKEALINLAVKEIPRSYDKIAWLDGDIILPDGWGQRIVHKLDTDDVNVVQAGGSLKYLNRDSSVVDKKQKARLGVGKTVSELINFKRGSLTSAIHHNNFPGMGWAARREFFDCGAGLWDEGIVGSGDFQQILASCGLVDSMKNELYMLKTAMSESERKRLYQFSRNSFKYVKGKLGYIKGQAYHIWHGSREKRQYSSRHSIVKGVDWKKDLSRDNNGLPVLLSHKYDLIPKFYKYFKIKEQGVL